MTEQMTEQFFSKIALSNHFDLHLETKSLNIYDYVLYYTVVYLSNDVKNVSEIDPYSHTNKCFHSN